MKKKTKLQKPVSKRKTISDYVKSLSQDVRRCIKESQDIQLTFKNRMDIVNRTWERIEDIAESMTVNLLAICQRLEEIEKSIKKMGNE